MNLIKPKIGRFSISIDVIQDNSDMVKEVFKGLIVVRAEMLYHSQAIEYTALGDCFDTVPEGEIPPYYLPLISKTAVGQEGYVVPVVTFNGWKRIL